MQWHQKTTTTFSKVAKYRKTGKKQLFWTFTKIYSTKMTFMELYGILWKKKNNCQYEILLFLLF